jgi:hypothetical protein
VHSINEFRPIIRERKGHGLKYRNYLRFDPKLPVSKPMCICTLFSRSSYNARAVKTHNTTTYIVA